MRPPPRVEIKTLQKSPDMTTPTADNNGIVKYPASSEVCPPSSSEEQRDITPDDLIATIQSAVDELLMDYQTSPEPHPQVRNKKVEEVFTSELLQRNEVSIIEWYQ